MERENHFQKDDEIISRYHPDYTSERLRQQMEQARQLSEMEVQASEERMAGMMAAERERLAEMRRQHAARRAEERRLILITLALIGLFLVSLAAYALISQAIS